MIFLRSHVMLHCPSTQTVTIKIYTQRTLGVIPAIMPKTNLNDFTEVCQAGCLAGCYPGLLIDTCPLTLIRALPVLSASSLAKFDLILRIPAAYQQSQQMCLHGDQITHTWSAERAPKELPSQFQWWRFTENSSRRRSRLLRSHRGSWNEVWHYLMTISDWNAGEGKWQRSQSIEKLQLVSSTYLSATENTSRHDVWVDSFKRVIWNESDTL